MIFESIKRNILRIVYALIIALVVVFVFKIRPILIAGHAMSPTLNYGERTVMNGNIGELSIGDIIVFYSPEKPNQSLFLRIVGLPGEKIEITETGQVLVNEVILEEPYLDEAYNTTPQEMAELLVPEQAYFLLGDNRDHGNDSRKWGAVPLENIQGKLIWRYFPFSEMGAIQ